MATDPRRVPQGTQYNAAGILTPPQLETEHGSARYAEPRDLVPDLGTPRQRILTYEKMLTSDAAPDVSLRAAKTPILGGEFFIDAFSEDQVDLDVAEFVETNLFSFMSTPFKGVAEDFLRCLDYGYSAGSPVWTMAEWSPKRSGANRKKYNMIRKIMPLPTPTIKKIEYDDHGGPTGIIQNAINSNNQTVETPIDIKDLMIVSFNRRGGNLEGKSVLRTAYPHWVYKTRLYKIDAIQKERHGIGVPKVKLNIGYSPADKTAAHELARNLRTNEWAHMVLPPGMDVEFAELHGNPVNVLTSIEHHNAMIMLNVLLEFLLAGIDAGGGRATSASQLDMFLKSSLMLAHLICDVFNQFLIPKLVGFNFKVQGLPQLRVRNVGQTRDMQQFAAAIANLAKQNCITIDEETENWIRRNFDMPVFHGTRPLNTNKGSNTNNGKGKIQPGNLGKDPASAQ